MIPTEEIEMDDSERDQRRKSLASCCQKVKKTRISRSLSRQLAWQLSSARSGQKDNF